MSLWPQFRELGLPRCHSFSPDRGLCNRLIWPWQEWACEVEEWPVHHECHHRHTEEMLAWLLKDERDNPLPSDPDYHWDGYDECRVCSSDNAGNPLTIRTDVRYRSECQSRTR